MAGTRRNHQKEHRYAVDNLSAYIDGELTPSEDARVKAHLDLCASCRQDAATLRATAQLLRQAPRQPLPRSFVLSPDAVGEQKSYRRWSLTQTWLRAGSAIVSAVLVVLLSGDVILSQGWFATRQSESAPVAMMVVEEAQYEAVEPEMEQPVDKASVIESQAQPVVRDAQAAPMITSVRPKIAPTNADGQPAEAPVAKMIAPNVQEPPADDGQRATSESAAGQPIAPPAAAPRTSSAPGLGGGGAAPDSVSPEQEAQPRAAESQVRIQPTLVPAPVEAQEIQSLDAPAPMAKDWQEESQSKGAEAVLMSGADQEPAEAAAAPMVIATSVPVETANQTQRGSTWSALRSAALIAFGALLMLVAGLLLAKSKLQA